MIERLYILGTDVLGAVSPPKGRGQPKILSRMAAQPGGGARTQPGGAVIPPKALRTEPRVTLTSEGAKNVLSKSGAAKAVSRARTASARALAIGKRAVAAGKKKLGAKAIASGDRAGKAASKLAATAAVLGDEMDLLVEQTAHEADGAGGGEGGLEEYAPEHAEEEGVPAPEEGFEAYVPDDARYDSGYGDGGYAGLPSDLPGGVAPFVPADMPPAEDPGSASSGEPPSEDAGSGDAGGGEEDGGGGGGSSGGGAPPTDAEVNAAAAEADAAAIAAERLIMQGGESTRY